MSSHDGISDGRAVDVGVRSDDTEFLLVGQSLLTLGVPTHVELALVLVRPLLGHMMRRVGRTGGEVMKNGVSGISTFCWRDQVIARSARSSVRV